MTIKDLKLIIKDLPENMIIGGRGYLGEYLEVKEIKVKEIKLKKHKKEKMFGLCITIEDKGEEPIFV
jgi:hypothetical protein